MEPHEENLVSTAVWLSQDLLEDGEKMMASGEVVANDHGDDRENGLKELTSRIAYC